MNAARRQRINAARTLIEQAASEEREAFEALPESFQDADQGQTMNAVADRLEEIVADLGGVLDGDV